MNRLEVPIATRSRWALSERWLRTCRRRGRRSGSRLARRCGLSAATPNGGIRVRSRARRTGWVPARYLSASEGDAEVRVPYDTRELVTAAGEQLTVVLLDEESGWL